ncbi:MAG: VCBS repeat-containing protein [Deltaproteobacteria bacterium]|nr:VCBS repeat-containing protein [Deltaproteobacteria bacterium]
MNGDGKPDAVIANANDGTVTIRLGDGLGGFPTATTHSLGVQGPQAVAVGFIDGDTDLDIVTVNDDPDAGDPDKVVLLIGNGTGGVESTASYSSRNPDSPRRRGLALSSWASSVKTRIPTSRLRTMEPTMFRSFSGTPAAAVRSPWIESAPSGPLSANRPP